MSIISLPIEINNLILEFTGYHKFRNGKYLKQLDINCRQITDLHERLLVRPPIRYGFVFLRFSDTSEIALFNHTYDYLSSGRL
jgi:hypothetical protein